MTFRPMPRRTAYCDPERMSQDGSEEGTPFYDPPPDGKQANVVTSAMPDGLHAPVLDVDFPAFVVPSSTPGHFHLYLDHPMTWEQYDRLLAVLAEVGIVSQHYAHFSRERERTVVRMPWTDKDPTPGPHAAPSPGPYSTEEPF